MSYETDIKETVDPPRYSLTFPIYQSSAFKLPEGNRYRYGRENNPTVEELGRIISLMEGAESTTCFSSGMGAISTSLLTLLKPGSKLVMPLDLFARSRSIATGFLREWGVKVKTCGTGTENVLKSLEDGSFVFLEAISNPSLRVYDIERISKAVHEKGGTLIVDSTFATPVNLKPLDHGADISLHSLSKFIGGHNDIIGGSVSGRDDLISRIDAFRRTLGTNMDPNTAFLAIRGIKTLGLRIEKGNKNALFLAQKLSEMNVFDEIIYPGLPEHPDHRIASRILKGFGAVLSFRVKKGSGSYDELLKKLKHIEAANTLGSVNTVISHPMTMSHRSLGKDELREIGVDENFFRLSLGIENPETILEDVLNMAN